MNHGDFVEPSKLDPLPPRLGFDFGRVLGNSLSAWACNVLPFTAVAALVFAPVLIYAFWVLEGPLTQERLARVDVLLLLGPLLLEPIVAGLIAKAVLRQHLGKPTGVREAIFEASRQILPLLGVTLIGGIAMGVLAYPRVAGIEGGGLLVIPAIMLYFVWFVVGPVAAIEKPGVMAALARSRDLTKGHRLKLFGILLLLAILTYVGARMLLSEMQAAETAEDFKLYAAIYYFILLNVATMRAVIRASAYVELAK